MRFDFVEAADGTPLSKTYEIGEEGLIETPYPMVRNLNSYSVEANTIDELFAELKPRAEAGQALMKGNLRRSITNESRAGLTSSATSTRWICLDLDFEDGWPDLDTFIAELNPSWSNVSYIWQHSASAGIKHPIGLRGHLIMLLDQSILPSDIKYWLTMRNLEVPGLNARVELAANGQSLKYPLDISTCQNDKALFIASPILRGIDSPISERYVLSTKIKDQAPLPDVTPGQADVDKAVDAKVTELRKKAGLPRQKAKYRTHGGERLLVNPDGVDVTDVKIERGFVYVNLNGGDSWGYYFPEHKPDVLYNFKGEPPVPLAQAAPEFYKSYVKESSAKRHGRPVKPIVFRDPMRDAYYNVLYYPDEDRIKMIAETKSKDRLDDFMGQYAEPAPDAIPDWEVEFKPTTLKAVDEEAQWINTYTPSDYLRYADDLEPVDQIPPIIDKIITSVTGSDQEAKEYFINWLAALIQTRQKLGTAWVFHGTTGTGKGIMYSKILQPLLGPKHVPQWTMKNTEEQYNAAIASACLLWLDEFHVDSSRNGRTVMDKLKNLVTEEEMAVRAMRTNTYMAPSYANLIVATNHPDPLALDENDRRFNVAPPQERSIHITHDEAEAIESELTPFTSYLWNYDVDMEATRTPLKNDARANMIMAAQNSVDGFFSALRNGDLDFFLGLSQSGMLNQYDLIKYNNFEEVLRKWCLQYKEPNNNPVKIEREDLQIVYEYCVGNVTTAKKLTRMCHIHRLEVVDMRSPFSKKKVKGLYVNFEATDHELVDQILEGGSESTHQPFQVYDGFKQ